MVEKAQAANTHGDSVRALDVGALKALAHPLRVQIYDLLSQYGPQTSSSLAELTGESSGSTSYHLRALAKHQLICEVEGRGSGRERWWERPRGGVAITNPEAMKTPSGKAATQVVLTEFLNRRHAQLMRYAAQSMLGGQPHDGEAIISTSTAMMTEQQTAELIEQVSALIDAAVDRYRGQTGEGVRPVTIRADIFPLLPEGAEP